LALLAALFLLVSPYVLYYSRYNRHDIQVIAWALLAFLRSFHTCATGVSATCCGWPRALA
jgi:predicted membrane-bound mannosyltransferase